MAQWIVSSKHDTMFELFNTVEEAKERRKQKQAMGESRVYVKKKNSGSYISDYR